MAIDDIARTDVVTTHREQSAGNLATVMSEEGVGSVIVEEDDRPVGIVTDRDLVIEVLEPRADPREVTAGEIMTPDPATVPTHAGVFEVAETMFDASVRRVPVVDERGSIAGIVTLDDFLVLFTDELGSLAGVIEAESPPY